MEKHKTTIEEKIMKEIQTGKVKVRSRYVFIAEKLGLGSVIVLSILLGALFFHLLFYYLDQTDNLVFLSFGRSGWYAFLESFPYLLVVSFILLVFVAGYLLKKTDFSYQKPFAYSSVTLLVVVMVGGAVLTFTGVAQSLEMRGFLHGRGAGIIRPFLHNCFSHKKYGISGQILEVRGQSLILLTPDGVQQINFFNAPPLDPQAVGKYIIVVGERKGETFQGVHVQVVPQERIPAIHRGVRMRFPLPPGILVQ